MELLVLRYSEPSLALFTEPLEVWITANIWNEQVESNRTYCKFLF